MAVHSPAADEKPHSFFKKRRNGVDWKALIFPVTCLRSAWRSDRILTSVKRMRCFVVICCNQMLLEDLNLWKIATGRESKSYMLINPSILSVRKHEMSLKFLIMPINIYWARLCKIGRKWSRQDWRATYRSWSLRRILQTLRHVQWHTQALSQWE